MKTRWLRWGAGLAGALGLYAALGFWAVPALLQQQLSEQVRAGLGREATVGELRFNPFTLRLEADDLQLTEADGRPLLGLAGLAVELDWRSVLRRAWSFAEVRLTQPAAALHIARDGTFNLARLADDIARRSPPREGPQELPRVQVARFVLEEGRIDLRDEQAGYSNLFTPIGFELLHFSTLPGQDDRHLLTARSARGGELRWRGNATLQPLQASGEIVIEKASLPELSVYLKPFVRAGIAAGRLDATLPYAVRYEDGRLEAAVKGARVALTDVGVAHEGASDTFAALGRLEVSGVDADLVRMQVEVREARAEGGRLQVRRDARGAIDLAGLARPGQPAAAAPAAAATAAAPWQLKLQRLTLDRMALQATDGTVSPPLVLGAPEVSLQLAATAGRQGPDVQFSVSEFALDASRLEAAQAGRPPLRVRHLSVTGGRLDTSQRMGQVQAVKIDGVQVALRRDPTGALDLASMLPAAPAQGPAAAAPAQAPWKFKVGTVELQRGTVAFADEATGVAVHAEEIGIAAQGVDSGLRQPVPFQVRLKLREGGQLAARGSVVPATGRTQADVQVQGLALAPAQALLARHVRLKLAGGSVSASGKLSLGEAQPRAGGTAAVRYEGALHVNGLALKNEDGGLFAGWKQVGADRLTLTVSPNRLDVPELLVQGVEAQLHIEEDRSLNATRLLVRADGAAAAPAPDRGPVVPVAAGAPQPATPSAAAAEEPFPVRIRRVRLEDARLDFSDLSLRPQFAAKVYELNGAITGLSSQRDARAQLQLEGRVDEFGMARVSGEINPFAPRDSTDIEADFRNVDLVPASPYSMKFAGYRVAGGKISVELRYKVKNGQLDGTNRFVLDRLTLGERVDSPDALRLPLQLALAILKDSDGRIDLGLPVSGNIDDPQFSYGAIVWQAITNVLTKIVTAPFRALGALLGVGGEKLESIDFDPGSARLLPPEREKLRQVAEILAKRSQLKLAVPGHYDEAADAAALKQRALRLEIAKRAGIRLGPDEDPGPLAPAERAVRVALRELFVQRFGKGELDKETAAAEKAAATPAAGASAAAAPLPAWQRLGKLVQGEPQLADASGFHAKLQQRLLQAQELPAGAAARLGEQRAAAIVEALRAGGVDAARASVTAAAPVDGAGRAVPVKLELSAR